MEKLNLSSISVRTKFRFESTPQLLGVTLDCQLTFGPHIDGLKKISLDGSKYYDASWVDPGAGTRHHSDLSTAPTYSPALCTVHRPGWHPAPPIISANLSLNSQHLSGARIITGYTRSTPTVPLLKEAGVIPLSVHANLAAAKLRERALRHTQETPIANAAAVSYTHLTLPTILRV